MDNLLLRLNRAITIVPDGAGNLVALNTNTGTAFPLTAELFSILESFTTPTTPDIVLASRPPSPHGGTEKFRMNVNYLCEQGALISADKMELARHDRNYFGAYQHLYHQREMLMDTARTTAFEAAIREVVTDTDIVIDAGSGTGILALLAARCGAKKVYAIERSRIVNIAQAISADNGYADRIEFAQCMAEDFRCNEPATILISELLGDFVLRELSFKSFCSVRDRCLTHDAITMPSRVRMYVAPVEDALLWQHDGPGYWRSPVYGFDYSAAYDIECARLGSVRVSVPETSLLAAREMVHDIDYRRTPVNDFYFESQVEFMASRSGTLHGFAGSFDMQLSPSVWLDTGSHSKETHWQQVFFPLVDPLQVKMNDMIILKIRVQDPENPQKRIPDSFLEVEIRHDNECIHRFSQWYDRARQGVF